MTIAYLTNSFPEPLEPYVWEEIRQLREHGLKVLPCSMRRPRRASNTPAEFTLDTLYPLPLKLTTCLWAVCLLVLRFFTLADFFWRVLAGKEPLSRRVRTLMHTFLGIYFAVLLRGNGIRHIHVHHGYFAAWSGMVAARLLHAGFSMTLHGSDLLLRADYLDTKLENCKFCITVSDFNRQYILNRYPSVDASKVIVQRLGIDPAVWQTPPGETDPGRLSILSVGRLHPVKNHAFLLLACRALKALGGNFRCVIAGEGDERARLEELIACLDLKEEVTLAGHVPREHLPELYAQADVVVLTSRSEGIPVTLMEAMAMERIVIAPEITGIPELVREGKTGFLYRPESMEQLLIKLQLVAHGRPFMDPIRSAARKHIEQHFNGPANLANFANRFLQLVNGLEERNVRRGVANENPVLQQV